MIEQTIYNELSAALDCGVGLERHGQAKPFVLIQKTGSGRSNFIDRATFAFQSYADTKLDAARLNEEVKNAVYEFIGVDSISAVELVSDYDFTDTTTKEHRYQAIYDFYYKE